MGMARVRLLESLWGISNDPRSLKVNRGVITTHSYRRYMEIRTKSGKLVEMRGTKVMAAYRLASDLRATGKEPSAEQVEVLRWVETTTEMDRLAMADIVGNSVFMTYNQQLVAAVWLWCDQAIEAHVNRQM